MKSFIEKALKKRMPVLGHDDTYFIGSGVTGASGNPHGEWTFLIGPDYTCPNYIESEKLLFDGEAIPFDVYRLRGMGAFFGFASTKKIRTTVTDACRMKDQNILRLITIENLTGDEISAHFSVSLTLSGDGTVIENGVETVKLSEDWCFGNRETKNWAERRMKVMLPGADVSFCDGTYILDLPINIPVDGMAVIPLWHCTAYGDVYVKTEENAEDYLSAAVSEWGAWLASGSIPVAGGRRLSDVIESLLLSVKMQQNRDGGMIAGIRKYANSYVRDTHGASRLLCASGHLEEVALLLSNIHSRFEVCGRIPNWWSMGSDSFIGGTFGCDAAEITAYYIFILRDWLAAGGDPSFAEKILPSVRYAADAQLEYLEEHDYLMCFNGDETEQYCVNRDGEEYGLFGSRYSKNVLGFNKKAMSFTATAAAAGSLAFFSRLTGEEKYAIAAENTRQAIKKYFWDEADGRHSWIYDQNGRRGTYLTNYSLMPLWLGIDLLDGAQMTDASAALEAIDPDTGYLPNCPGLMDGFCGNTPGIALFCAVKLGHEKAADLAEMILSSNLLGRYGTVSEFYGPGGTPNGHNCRPFEGGIVGDALIQYARSLSTQF